jgi:delta-aminolevulinic acid dehydratase/porphobilinogen synthase
MRRTRERLPAQLDTDGFEELPIVAYSAKFASAERSCPDDGATMSGIQRAAADISVRFHTKDVARWLR